MTGRRATSRQILHSKDRFESSFSSLSFSFSADSEDVCAGGSVVVAEAILTSCSDVNVLHVTLLCNSLVMIFTLPPSKLTQMFQTRFEEFLQEL